MAVIIASLDAASSFHRTHVETENGPIQGNLLEAIGVHLNLSLYEDGTGVIHQGSTWPGVQTDDENCITSATVLPVTDELLYTSNLVAENIIPDINIIGMQSLSPFSGQMAGSFGLMESQILDLFPSTPTYITDKNGQIFYPGPTSG